MSFNRQLRHPPTPQFSDDRYGRDVLGADPHDKRMHVFPVTAQPGLVVEDVASGFVGEILSIRKIAGTWVMTLEGRRSVRREFPLGRGYWIDGVPVDLQPPVITQADLAHQRGEKLVAGHTVTASGSLHTTQRARRARASRIWVEGKHDAQLIQKIWGEDLAYVGVVVQELSGVDHLLEVLDEFAPSETARAGVLVDHLVPGSKESRIANDAMRIPGVMVVGHSYVDVWQAVKPHAVGIPAWPDVPRGEDIKVGTLARLGWPHATAQDVGMGWARILDSVHSYKDLEPSILAPVETLIDFVTEPDENPT
ncbi:MAG: DUF3097 family protein [Actinomycetaceae bacterium]|nr:DUF3097 family protein [Actinomycetaceae bacterium]MDY6083129.1 DUF3097 family protein [Actinomycetaceae bacterium]